MELALTIWLISSLNDISKMLSLFIILVGSSIFISFAILLIASLPENATSEEQNKGQMLSIYWLKRSVPLLFVLSIFNTLMPSTNTGWLMAGGYLVQYSAQSDVGKKFTRIVELNLEQVLDEVTEQAKLKAKSIRGVKPTEKE